MKSKRQHFLPLQIVRWGEYEPSTLYFFRKQHSFEIGCNFLRKGFLFINVRWNQHYSTCELRIVEASCFIVPIDEGLSAVCSERQCSTSQNTFLSTSPMNAAGRARKLTGYVGKNLICKKRSRLCMRTPNTSWPK